MTAERAILFIDGSNFYHATRDIGIAAGDLDYRALAHKLVLSREIAGIRYYVGGKKAFAASPATGIELEKTVDTFTPLKKEWFSGLFI